MSNSTFKMLQYYRFCWLLFLSLRIHPFSRFKDLLTCTNGLVSVLAILIIHVPVCFRNFNINDSPRFVKKGDKVDLLVSLSSIYETSIDDLRETMNKVNNLIREKLKKKPCLASEIRAENLENLDTDFPPYRRIYSISTLPLHGDSNPGPNGRGRRGFYQMGNPHLSDHFRWIATTTTELLLLYLLQVAVVSVSTLLQLQMLSCC